MDAVERVEEILAKGWLHVKSDLRYKTAVVREDDLRTLLALARSHSWQPIESAPKDGTRIQAASWSETDGWRQFVVFWNLWYHEPFWQFGGCAEHPTHWQPLPSPPHTGGR